MNKTLKLALTAVAGTVLIAPASAQGMFPDVPDDHWAYEAVENLQDEGILVGYPDGLYRGQRPLSRYELAIALNAAYTRLMGMQGGLEGQIEALEEMIREMEEEMETGGGTVDMTDIRNRLEDLEEENATMMQWGDEIQDMQRLAEAFEAELASIGVDVEAMKADLDDMEDRLTAVEEKLPDVKITGQLDALVLAGHSSDDLLGLTQDGRTTGVGRQGTFYANKPVGMTRDLSVLHQAAFTFEGTNEEGPDWHATLSVGNLADAVALNAGPLNSYGDGTAASNFSDDGNTDVYFRELVVSWGGNALGQTIGAEIGRVGYQVGSYLWKRTDYTTWFDDEYYDNGNYYFDGGIVSFNFGEAALEVFGGRNSNRNTTNGLDLNPISLGNGQVDTTIGAHLDFPIGVGDEGGVSLAYLLHDSDNYTPNPVGAGSFNRLNVYGAEVDLQFDNFTFFGALSASTLSAQTDTTVDDENLAWDANLGYTGDNFGVSGGYRRVEGNFAAAGSWGRLGTFWNPTNIEGFNAQVYVQPTDAIKVYAKGEFVEGIENAGTLHHVTMGGGLTGDDNINTYTVGLDYMINDAFDFMASYEYVDFDYSGVAAPNPTQQWFTVGLNYNLGADSDLLISYTYSDIDNDGVPGATPLAPAAEYRGGLLGTQLSIRF